MVIFLEFYVQNLVDLAQKEYDKAKLSGNPELIALSKDVLDKACLAKSQVTKIAEYDQALLSGDPELLALSKEGLDKAESCSSNRTELSLRPGKILRLLTGKEDLTHPDSWVCLPRATPVPEKSTYTQTVLIGGKEHLLFVDDSGNTFAQALTQRGWDENIGAPYNGH